MSATPSSLQAQLRLCTLRDARRLARSLDRARRGQTRRGEKRADDAPGGDGAGARSVSGSPGGLEGLEAEIARAVEKVRERRARVPVLTYPEELPVSGALDELRAALAASPVVVVCGETGSGKTTQLPKLLLELGHGARGQIAHTQPRRIAARSVAARLAEETGLAPGRDIGYQVRFEQRTDPGALVKVMTDGVLLAEIASDPDLLAYDALIVDEAHERSLNIDLLLGYLQRLLPRRPELRVVVTSATLDAERLSSHFGGAPIVEVSGRGHPVEIRYRPVRLEEGEEPLDAMRESVRELLAADQGDVLVFLSGEREIRDAARLLREEWANTGAPGPGGRSRVDVVPLFARLGSTQQQRIFDPGPAPRVVLATNVAETSITVPRIRSVVDLGTARISRYSARSRVQRLPVEPISRSSATQRAGRCGRIGPGVCVRLYAEEDLAGRPEFTEPEITRTGLAAVVLRMLASRLGDVGDFPFLDPPDRRQISEAFRLLRELGAIESPGGQGERGRAGERRRRRGERGGPVRLTRIGRQLARLPVDPRIGRIILAAGELGCLSEILPVAAALGSGDPRERPFSGEERALAASAHEPFLDRRSDFLAYLNLWQAARSAGVERSWSRLRSFCREHYLSVPRMREWMEVHRQLRFLARELRLSANTRPATYARIHQALLAGLSAFVGVRDRGRVYRGLGGQSFRLSGASALRPESTPWLLAAELVETKERYAHTAARIRPEWIERAARRELERDQFEPWWDPGRAEVMAHERVTLKGLTLVARRRVRLGPVDPVRAREVFIWEGLVGGGCLPEAGFQQHNRRLLDSVRALEEKLRRRDLLASDEVRYRWFDERLPGGIWSEKTFARWFGTACEKDPAVLRMAPPDLLRPGAGAVVEAARPGAAFPDELVLAGARLPLVYRFAPGEEGDGVTARVPLALLPALDPVPFEWVVPGLLAEKVEALLRGLPKRIRRTLVPIGDAVGECLAAGAEPGRPLLEVLEERIRAVRGVQVPRALWPVERLPAHLRVRFEILGPGERGVIASGRDLSRLQARLGRAGRRRFERRAADALEQRGLTDWTFGDLPPVVCLRENGAELRVHPGLADEGTEVSLRAHPTAVQARLHHRRGVLRLLTVRLRRSLAPLRRSLERDERLALLALTQRTFPGSDGGAPDAGRSLAAQIIDRAVERVCLPSGAVPLDRAAFEAALARAEGTLPGAVEEVRALLERILLAGRRAGPLIERLASLEFRDEAERARRAVASDGSRHLDALLYAGFLGEVPLEVLSAYPRYLEGLARRFEKLPAGLIADADRLAELEPLWKEVMHHWLLDPCSRGEQDGSVAQCRWLLEEVRVSLFAQALGARQGASVKRVARLWNEIGAEPRPPGRAPGAGEPPGGGGGGRPLGDGPSLW